MSSREPNTNGHDERAAGLGSLRVSFTIFLLCVALVGGNWLRTRSDARGIVMPPGELGPLEAQNVQDQPVIPLMTYYGQIEKMLKAKYVDPVTNEDSLADGAVRGMVSSLAETNSNFYTPEMAKAYLARQAGDYAGIGIDIETRQSSGSSLIDASALHPTSDVLIGRVPDLLISAVAPGSPAAKAGLQIGDQINFIDGSWVVNQAPLTRLEELAKKAGKSKDAATAFTKLLIRLRGLADASMTASKAMADLQTGVSGSVKLGVLRDGKQITIDVGKGKTKTLATGLEPGGALRLRFTGDAATELKKHLGSGPLTIDLRDQPAGDFTSMLACFNLLAPKGTYGQFTKDRKGSVPEGFEAGSAQTGTQVTLLVNKGTAGAAAIFAKALAKAGLAKIDDQGMPCTPAKVSFTQLEDGSAYTLGEGVYSSGSQLSPHVIKPSLGREIK